VSAEIGLRDTVLIWLCSRRVSVLTASKVEFGVIPKDHWNQPDWIDEEEASSARHRMEAANVKYGGA
jgi:alpha 1,2-mannosyltransferase